MKPNGTACYFHPSIFFLLLTLIVTSAATAMLCVAMMTQHWEYITWDKEKLNRIEKNLTSGSSDVNFYGLEWLLDGQVARVVLELKYFQERQSHSSKKTSSDEEKDNSNLPALFFAPIRGGIWTYCINLNNEQHKILQYMGFPKGLCTNYLQLGTIMERNVKMDWQHRMQNLSISCALVCLIILSSSAIIGTFGVTKQQNSAILVTGILYLLAAIFATFSLIIINFKRTRNKSDCLNTSTSYGYAIEGVIVSATALEKAFSLNKVNKYFEARIFTTGYSFQLGWGGIATCILVSILWIFLSKIMRFNPINALFLLL